MREITDKGIKMTVANQEKYIGVREKLVLLFDKLQDRFRESKAFATDTLEKLIRVRSTLIGFLHIPFISLYLTEGEEV